MACRIRRRRLRIGAAYLLTFGLFAGLGQLAGRSARAEDAGPPVDPAAADFFETKVRPVLAAHCWECHGPDKQKSGLRLDSRAGRAQGGRYRAGRDDRQARGEPAGRGDRLRWGGADAAQGKAFEGRDRLAFRLGQAGRAPGLSTGQIAEARRRRRPRIPLGSSITAKDREFWSFRPVRQPEPPAVRNESWPRSAIDRFILAKLESSNLKPAAPADKQALLRRVTFDLIGLPPTPEEIEAFVERREPRRVRESGRPAAGFAPLRRAVGPALARRRALRRGPGPLVPAPALPCGFRYRDWVIQALNRDMPYDRFLIEQIAGDLIDGPGRSERLPALGFFALGPVYYGDAKKFDQYADRIDTLTRGVLGLTVACARCHDHKFDPIPTTDYYALAGVFASTEYQEVPCAPKEQVDAYDSAQAADPEEDARDQCVSESRGRTAQAEGAPQPDRESRCRPNRARSWPRCGPSFSS